MIEIKPFRAFRYNRKRFSDISKLVCPPYDVISPSLQAEYYKLGSYNMIRLILPKGYPADNEHSNRYIRSAVLLKRWLDNDILVQDKAEGIYAYEQRYRYNGKILRRRGFISLLKIQADMIHPHEHTHLKPKEDRLQLLKQVKANLSPIFVLFSDRAGYLQRIIRLCSKQRPLLSFNDDTGIGNRLWRIEDNFWLEKLRDYMNDKHIFIADGHHRFEVACAYRDMLKHSLPDFSNSAPYNYIMAYFTAMDSPALTIMAVHRLIKDTGTLGADSILERILRYFNITDVKNKTALLKAMDEFSKPSGVFGMYLENKLYVLHFKAARPKDQLRRLDVSLFNNFILKETLSLKAEDKNIIYSSDIDEAIRLVKLKRAKVVFFLRPTKIQQLKSVVMKKQRMPPKSTYFYPKLLSGLVIHKF